MTSDRRFHLLALLLALPLGLAACGNYSNEDLEFMNALPDRSALEASMPPAAILLAREAELARTTHKTTRDFNGLLASLVTMVDWIRSNPPTSRTRDSRQWGPYAADRDQLKNRDFKTRMIVKRSLMDPNQFDYEISVHKDGTSDLIWPVFIRGSFHTSETARRGTGYVELVTADVRAAGLDVTDLNQLDHLRIDYDTVDDPVWIKMTYWGLADPASSDPAPMLEYVYRSTFAGQGQMTFDLYANLIPSVTGASEHMRVTSQWLPSGAGRSTLKVVEGDGAGSTQNECWNRHFEPTFNDKPWAMDENVSGDPSDPEICPVIPTI